MSFSVIIATRNRPALFKQAIESVQKQSCTDLEIVVVDDGSSEENQAAYRAIAQTVEERRAHRYSLIARPNGHGHGYARNFGVARATGTYLCFLDDDDCWTDPDHLQRAQRTLDDADGADGAADVYLTNQVAFFLGKQKPGPIWIEDLTEILERRGREADRSGAYTVSIGELMTSQGFCHLNALIVKRELYEKIGGIDETIRWEEDRDLYLRLIDNAELVKYSPLVVSRHNIPDPAKTANVTTGLSELEKRLSQIRVLDRATLFGKHAEIRAHGRRHKAYALKKIAEHLDRIGRHTEAAFYAREALGAGPTVKWAGYAAWLELKGLGGGCQ